MQTFARLGPLTLFAGTVLSQSSDPPPRFEIADVHTIPEASFSRFGARLMTGRKERYEIHSATMLDLIRIAWATEPDKILGGPNWLQLDLFDLTAKMPTDTSPETQRLMLQALLNKIDSSWPCIRIPDPYTPGP